MHQTPILPTCRAHLGLKKETLRPLFSHFETIQQGTLSCLICQRYVWFHSIIISMAGKGHYHLWWHTLFQGMYNKCPSCGVRSNHFTEGDYLINRFLPAVLHKLHLSCETKHFRHLLDVFVHFLI